MKRGYYPITKKIVELKENQSTFRIKKRAKHENLAKLNLNFISCLKDFHEELVSNGKIEIYNGKTMISSIPSDSKNILFSKQYTYKYIHPLIKFEIMKKLTPDGRFSILCQSPPCSQALLLIDETTNDPEGKAFYSTLSGVGEILQKRNWPYGNTTCNHISVAFCYDQYLDYVQNLNDFNQKTINMQEPLNLYFQLKKAFKYFKHDSDVEKKIIYIISYERSRYISETFLSVVQKDFPSNKNISLHFLIVGNKGNSTLKKLSHLYGGQMKICKNKKEIIEQIYLLLFNLKGDLT
ncbi:hypothetical protein MHK_007171 [Candidatus Magnetomorum sp. HK-1]|nr:hypothetical protein MHK_007171 [Candidatus Magnetomorum sp. HK-1]